MRNAQGFGSNYKMVGRKFTFGAISGIIIGVIAAIWTSHFVAVPRALLDPSLIGSALGTAGAVLTSFGVVLWQRHRDRAEAIHEAIAPVQTLLESVEILENCWTRASLDEALVDCSDAADVLDTGQRVERDRYLRIAYRKASKAFDESRLWFAVQLRTGQASTTDLDPDTIEKVVPLLKQQLRSITQHYRERRSSRIP